MDADTRHELKQNELAEALARLRNLRDPGFLYSAIALGLIVVGVIIWYGWRYSQQRHLEDVSRRLVEAQDALFSREGTRVAGAQEDLRGLIKQAKEPDLAAAARLLLARAHYDQAMSAPEQRVAGFEEAARLLEEIRQDTRINAVLDAAATYLLANTYESLWRIDEAKQLWTRLAEDNRYVGTPYKDLARDRLADLAELAPVAMQPGAPPAPTTAEVSGASGLEIDPGSIMVYPEERPPFVEQPEGVPSPIEAPREVAPAAENAEPPTTQPAP